MGLHILTQLEGICKNESFSLYLNFCTVADFWVFFSAFYGQHSVTEAWTNPSPWSIILYIYTEEVFLSLILVILCFLLVELWNLTLLKLVERKKPPQKNSWRRKIWGKTCNCVDNVSASALFNTLMNWLKGLAMAKTQNRGEVTHTTNTTTHKLLGFPPPPSLWGILSPSNSPQSQVKVLGPIITKPFTEACWLVLSKNIFKGQYYLQGSNRSGQNTVCYNQEMYYGSWFSWIC